MNFKIGRFFYLSISFILGLFFLIFGAFSIILPWSSSLQNEITHFIMDNTLIFSLFGLGFALIGISIIVYTILTGRKRYVTIKTGSRPVDLDENVIQHYLETYWEENFPKYLVSFELKPKKKCLQIIAHFPFLTKEEQKVFLERVNNDFKDLFGKTLGYPNDVQLVANFSTSNQLSA